MTLCGHGSEKNKAALFDGAALKTLPNREDAVPYLLAKGNFEGRLGAI